MAYDLDIRHFFKRSPRHWLRRYFERHGVLSSFGWDSLKKLDIEPLRAAFDALDADLRARMTEDFNNIKLLASPAGKLQIIDEADFQGDRQEVAAKLAELDDFYSCAFWVHLERHDCWDGAIFYAAADSKPKRYWRTRINMPRLGRHPTSVDGDKLAAAITQVFRNAEARGDHCVVHQYRRRGDREYYFAYPQDHRQTAIEYHDGEMTKRPHKPAFEIIFVHDDQQQRLSIWHDGPKHRIQDLQVAFAKSVLGCEIPRDSPRDDRVYDLDPLINQGFIFHPSPELGIASVEVRKIAIRVFGPTPYTTTIELGSKTPGHVLYERLEAVRRDIRPSMLRVLRVGMRVTFELGPNVKRPKTRSFEVVAPNSCSLRADSYAIPIQQMLAEHGLEPRLPTGKEPHDNPDE